MKIIEEKIRYNGEMVRAECLLLRETAQEIVLLYGIPHAFQLEHITIPLGSFTIAYYYYDKPYNLYHMVTSQGQSLAYYFNLVKDVHKKGNILSYQDLILDILVTNDLKHFLLDLDELPCPLEEFEEGRVQRYMEDFLASKNKKIDYFKRQSKYFIENNCLQLWNKYFPSWP